MPHGLLVANKKALECIELKERLGTSEAAKHLKITTETLRRYISEYKKRQSTPEEKNKDFSPSAFLKKIGELYSETELKAIAAGGRIIPGTAMVPIIDFEGQHIKIGAMSDTHIGHKEFCPNRLFQAFEEFRKQKVDFVTHSGDVCEGMSHRPGHIYELDHLGYDQQKQYAIELFSQYTESPIYAIDGNHDRWFIKSNGALIVKDIASALPNFNFIGHDEGDISLKGLATLKLWHGEDGNSYALSYRVQKIIEAFSGGEKPSIMLCGHTHKYVKLFERNVHAISVGCIEGQTSWMRSKRIAAATGFSIFDVVVNKLGICKLTETWFPFY